MREDAGIRDGDHPAGVSELEALYVLTDRLYRARSFEDIFEAGLDTIIRALNCDRASILLFDADGVMRFKAWRGLSEGYRTALDGHTPWRPGEQDPDPIFVSDIDETEESDAVKARIRQEGIRGLGFIPLTLRGAVIGKFMTYYGTRHAFTRHEVELAVNIARQVGFAISHQHAAEELKQSEERFRAMTELAPVMIWMSDESGACLHLNRALREAWQVAEEDVCTFDWRTTLHPDDAEAVTARMTQAVVTRSPVCIKARYRAANGDYRTFETEARPRISPAGQFLGMIGVNVDVTERDRIDAQRELMLAELNHRVKNTLSVVQALANQTFKPAEAYPALRPYRERLSNLARAHDLLVRDNWEATPLNQIIDSTVVARSGDPARFALEGPELLLPPKMALAVAMALHELHTNAVKYGALSVGEGKVSLNWSSESAPEATLCLTWREAGGPDVRAPAKRGFGTVMIESILASDMGGSVALQFPPEGVCCEIRAPLRHAT